MTKARIDPATVVEEFVDRDQSGGGYQRNWDKGNMIYSVPELGGFENGHLAVGPEREDDEADVYAVIVLDPGL